MSVFTRLIQTLKPEHREEFAKVAEPPPKWKPNSEDGPASKGRRLAGERRVATRNMDELIGMCRMVIADGAVEDQEAQTLLNWIESTYHAAHEWPGNVLYQRLTQALADGHIDPDEESELLDILAKVAGGPPAGAGPSVSGAVPYDTPLPSVVFPEHCFALTGQFVYGPRKKVTATIEELGGTVADSVSKKCQYLIVGTFGSEEWLHSAHGTKIIKAVELKASGKPICIITEKHWTDHL